MKVRVKKVVSALGAGILLLLMILFLISPARYAGSVRDGISLWAVSVLPATFPFLVLTALFTRQNVFSALSKKLSPVTGKLFRVSGAGGCAAILSALSGYPVGARAVYDLKRSGQLQSGEELRVAALASTTGPMFLVGAVGAGMFGSAKAGWIMLVSHLLAVWTVCFVLRFSAKKVKPLPVLAPIKREGNFSDILLESVLSVLTVGGAIALFYAFGQMLSDLGAFTGIARIPYLEGTLRGLLEMTTGASILARSPSPLALALSCFLITFGGVCVLVQQWIFLAKTGAKLPLFLLIKFLQGVLSALICFGLSCAFGV